MEGEEEGGGEERGAGAFYADGRGEDVCWVLLGLFR